MQSGGTMALYALSHEKGRVTKELTGERLGATLDGEVHVRIADFIDTSSASAHGDAT